MKHLYFVRHGESTANVEDLIGGETDWHLTDKGRLQAIDAGEDAARKKLLFDVIISSPLIRALETAEAIAKRLGLSSQKIEITADIQERFFGELEGLHENAFGISKDEYLQNPRSIDHFKDVETILQLHKRAEKVQAELMKRPEETILLVSHAAFGRSLRKVIEGRPFDEPTENFENAKIIKLI